MRVYFYVAYPYYFPHFLPISELLNRQGEKVTYILSDKQNSKLMIEIAQKHQLDYYIGEQHLFSSDADWIFFANIFSDIDQVKSKTIFMDHGVGTKACNYMRALDIYNLVLVEGDYRYQTLIKDFPQHQQKIKKVGFSKLDKAINFSTQERETYIKKYNINNNRPTILYAPTFFPSSIEKMSKDFPKDFKDCNIIIKPHYLSLHRNRYKRQQTLFKQWASYENCTVCDASEYSLTPFLNLCDIMISDESSAIFEFTALDKPVILNRFLKLRWSYYINPKKLFDRLDSGIDTYRQIGDNAQNYQEMVMMVRENLKNPSKYKKIRTKYTLEICGEVDGQASKRIIEELKNYQK
jgi:CDP-glycerol glycerophosphotransferase (TagB/SpsB family)